MEFEKAVFRVYERSMEGVLSEEESQQPIDQQQQEQQQPMMFLVKIFKRPCVLFQHCMVFFTIFFMLTLIVLHSTFVGSQGCLPRELMVMNTTTGKSSVRQFERDEILYIRLSKHLLVHSGSNLRTISDDDTFVSDTNNAASGSIFRMSSNGAIASIRPNSRSLLNMIGVSPRDSSERFEDSLLHTHPSVAMSVKRSSAISKWALSSLEALSAYFMIDRNSYNSKQQPSPLQQQQRQRMLQTITDSPTWSPTAFPTMSPSSFPTTNNNSSSSSSNSSSVPDSKFVPFDYDYQITFDGGVTMLNSLTRHEHGFQTYNITLGDNTQCFGSSFAVGLLSFGGIDIAILNNLMYTINRSGYMLTRTGELFRWYHSDIVSRTIGQWIVWKVAMIINTFLSFFFLTTTTSLLVRVLISSGVIIIFPIFWLLQVLFGLEPINLRIVSISYPWIGLPLQLIRSRNQSLTPFIIGHLSKVILYYLMYVGVQSLYLSMFYSDSVTFGLDQVWLFAVMMVWEYYTMIYVRSTGSIVLFSRASLALFVMYHFYYYSFPSGFHTLALTTMSCALVTLMIFCVRTFELKAFRQGLVNIEQPRMLYVSLPWPSWRADLAPEYTLFMPVNSRSSSIYQDQVPARPNTEQPADATAGQGTAGSGNIEMTPVTERSGQDVNGTANADVSSTPLSFISRLLNPTNYQSTANREQSERGAYTSVNTDSTHG